MALEDLVKAIVGFLLGLIAKVVYDLWNEQRKRKSVLITKTILSSFALSDLEENLRKDTQVSYSGYSVKSIFLVRVELENNGSAAIKSQAINIRFGKEALILGEPQSESSSEDLRFIEADRGSFPNSRRFIIKLLQKKRRVAWNLAVVNHDSNDFIVEHGLATNGNDVEEADLDVVSTITSEKAVIDLTSRFRRILILLVAIPCLSIIRNGVNVSIINNYVGNDYLGLISVLVSVLTLTVWFFILREFVQAIDPFLEWLSGRESTPSIGGDSITIGDIYDASGIAVGNSASAEVAQILDYNQFDTIKRVFASLIDVAENSPDAKNAIELLKYEILNLQDAEDAKVARLIETVSNLLPEASSKLADILSLPIVKKFGGPATLFILTKVTSP